MSIRRKSTAHDLATLRLHPDGSRVQQSAVNARRRRARSTVVDSRGNWIAKDAGGKSSVKTRRNVAGMHTDDMDREFIDLSGDGDAHNQGKGKERVRDSQTLNEDPLQDPESGRLNTRARRRISFMQDLSFLDPPPMSGSSLEHFSEVSPVREPVISFPDPAPDLLKSIHHFASCYYRERGQLLDSSRNYRGSRKERRKQSQDNIHVLAANTHQEPSSETELAETEDEAIDEDQDESEVMDVEDDGREERATKVDSYGKDMYKALDGSALMAIGIVLQEYVAHTLSSRAHTLEGGRRAKRGRTGEDDHDKVD